MTPHPRPSRRSPLRRVLRALAAGAVALGLALAVPVAASALPPDGAGPDTPGTRSKVWPAKVKAGERLYFEVWGYPAKETVYIKIDDGTMCSDTSHGACVYHTQKLDGKGHAKGSLVVPDLKAGKHWLRMLATGDVFDSKTGEKLGYQGYTRRGGNDFKVVAGGSTDKQVGDAPGGGSTTTDGTITGGEVQIDVGDESPSPSASTTPEATITPEAPATSAEGAGTASAQPVPGQDGGAPPPASEAVPTAGSPSGLPVAGIAVLAGAVVVGGGAVGWALIRRNRLARAATTPE